MESQEAYQFSSDISANSNLGQQIDLSELLFERMPMGIAILDPEFRIQRYNPTWGDFAERYAPTSGAPLKPGVGYFEHLPGAESTILPLFERTLAGETIRQDSVRLESGENITYWDIVLTPLVENGETVGVLNVAVDATERVTARQNLERRVVERTKEIERRREAAESLRGIMAVLNSERSFQEINDYITACSAKLLRADACVIFSVQDKLLTNVSGFNMPAAFASLKSGEIYLGAANRQLLEGNPVQIKDARTYLRDLLAKPDLTEFQRRWYSSLRENFASYFSFPLVVRNQLFGGLVFYYYETHHFAAEDLQLGALLGEHAALAIENARHQQAEQERQRELQILLDVAEAASSSLNLEEVVAKTLDLLVALITASRAGVILMDEESGRLGPYTLRPAREIDSKDLARITQASQGVIDSGETLYIAPDASAGLLEPGALLPLHTRGKKLGVLGIIGPEGGAFTSEQLALFKSIADQLSVAIENAYLFEKAEQAAIIAERGRLARDLHDAVTQTLFSSSMIADVLPKIWERNQEEGHRRLEELRQLTRGALSEMRTLLVELRPAALVDTDLGDLIGHQVNAFIARTRVAVVYERHCMHNPPPEIKETFYRITQEALNNIAKHAEATQVNVRLDCLTEWAELLIEDNGIGFDPHSSAHEGLGLGIMDERARNVGANLAIYSKIRAGSRLRLTWQQPDIKERTHE